MSARKEWKQAARKNLKRHYLLFVAVCLVLAFLGSDYANSLSALRAQIPGTENAEVKNNTGLLAADNGFQSVMKAIEENQLAQAGNLAKQNEAKYRQDSDSSILGHRRGVLAQLVNSVTSGNILVMASQALISMFHSTKVMLFIMIFGSFLMTLLWWAFIQDVASVVAARLFLEGRIYSDVPPRRFLFLHDACCWFRVACTMLYTWCLLLLWTLTVVGVFIKRYSYFLVPYITAENPKISPREAVTLSRRMMDGHKWECFVLELSFLGWSLLGVLTAGISEILYSNPYRSATLCEYYASLRAMAIQKQIPGFESLCDTYLFEKAEAAKLEEAYPAEIPSEAPQTVLSRRSRISAFFADVFGIAATDSPAEQAWQRDEEAKLHARRVQDAQAGNAYPTRLSFLSERERRGIFRPELTHYIRHYSFLSLTLIFFSFSIVGWIWEVSLHLIFEGNFVNRGSLLGPWLPIYGSGAVLILVFLNRLRSKPLHEFAGIIALCGFVEYFTSAYLEKIHGMRWWDYTGYMLNLNGRICAEGLLVFGIGGMGIVYLLAPRFDSLLRRVPRKLRVCLSILLLLLFAADLIYSASHPNTGVGITS